MGVNMTCDIKWDKIFKWEYIDSHSCIAAFASDYGGKTNIIIIKAVKERYCWAGLGRFGRVHHFKRFSWS